MDLRTLVDTYFLRVLVTENNWACHVQQVLEIRIESSKLPSSIT